jgi:hypothetical protein
VAAPDIEVTQSAIIVDIAPHAIIMSLIQNL